MSPPNRSGGNRSRKGEIPRNFILNWHSSGSRGASPLVRRPITACQSCRAAKVKCDGRQDCNRCSSRGITCRFVNTDSAEPLSFTQQQETQRPQQQPQQQQQQRQQEPGNRRSSAGGAAVLSLPPATTATATITTTTATTTQTTPSEAISISMDLDAMDTTDHFSLDHAVTYHEPLLDNMVDWATETLPQSLDDIDWRAIDPNLNAHPTSSDLDAVFHSPHSSAPPSVPLTSPTRLFVGPNSHNHVHSHSTSTAAAYSSSTTPPSAITTPSPLSSSQLFNSPNCACREGLALLVPRLKAAVQEKHLDEVLKVTSDVLNRCQDIVDCTGCRITCTDLICMMAVFQQTDMCFEYISKAELDSSIKLNFGGHEISIHDPNLRAMLVMDLVQQATMVLDAISTKGQSMLKALGSPSLLARANIGYLETVIGDFRKLLRTVADLANANEGGYLSSRGSSTRILDSVSR